MTYFSDTVPSMVLPDTPAARDMARKELAAPATWAFCSDYRKESEMMTDENGRTWRGRCANRRLDGDREHLWCMRCPSGYIIFEGAQAARA